MQVAGPSTMPTSAPAARRYERAAGGRNIPPRLAKEPMYSSGLFNSAQKNSNIRLPAYQRLPSLSDKCFVPRTPCSPKLYPPKEPPRYLIEHEICNNYLRGWCRFGQSCHRRHVSPSEYRHVEDYNPPPVKLPLPISIEPESPPGVTKVRFNNGISDAAWLKVHTIFVNYHLVPT
ncbi:hypothetical protein DFS33DRAFT_1336362 [Desarmillaria ectypa]|nr:hypothetical protein DFS33DRAFT_1336362 [Desarmillaria ectypa]